jgi:hypothetical protein
VLKFARRLTFFVPSFFLLGCSPQIKTSVDTPISANTVMSPNKLKSGQDCLTTISCAANLQCENQIVTVIGRVDKDNVFDRLRYPNLSYQKFVMLQEPSRKPIEVWLDDNVNAAEASQFMVKLRQAAVNGQLISVSGRIQGQEIFMPNGCQRVYRLILSNLRFSDASISKSKGR